MQRTKLVRSFLVRVTQINGGKQIAVQDIKTGDVNRFYRWEDAWSFIEKENEAYTQTPGQSHDC